LTALELARWRLASVWFTACGFLFLILVGQSLGGVYEGGVQSAWGWALPNFVPTLALMISVFAADALKPYDEGGGQQVRSPFFKLSMSLSIFYLFVLILTLLAQPIVSTLRNGEATKMSPLPDARNVKSVARAASRIGRGLLGNSVLPKTNREKD
jgi:hypothetical protein